MKTKRHPIGKIVTFSQGKIKEETTIYSGSPLDENLSNKEFKKKYNMTKERFQKLDKKYRATTNDPDGLGCISSEEREVMQGYKEMFGVELPIENSSWRQREYAFKEGKKAILGIKEEQFLLKKY